MMKKHNSLAERMYKLNLAMRRVVCAFYIVASVILNLSLHLIMDSHNSFGKWLNLEYIVSVILVGFGIGLLLSM